MFSIIIPVYNTPSEQLKASINSCINQTYSDIEIIIINDGSNQECLDVLETYAAKDKRIILINGDKGGVSRARNKGLESATKKYILFLDSDDIFDINTCQFIKENLPDKNTLLSWDFDVFTGKMYDTKLQYKKEVKTEFSNTELKEKVLDLKSGFDVIRCKLYKTEIIKTHGIKFCPELTQGEDIIFNMDYFPYVKNCIKINKILYHYRKDFTSHSQRFNPNYGEKIRKFCSEIMLRSNQGLYDIDNCNSRVIQGVFAALAHYFFHPDSYLKLKDLKKYLEQEPFKKSIKDSRYRDFSFQRRIPLFFLKHNNYFFLKLTSKIRWIYLKHRYK